MKRILCLAAFVLPLSLHAQLVTDYAPPRSGCSLSDGALKLADAAKIAAAPPAADAVAAPAPPAGGGRGPQGPPTPQTIATRVQAMANGMQDWNGLSRYHASDELLKVGAVVPGRVVFMGDSITDGWKLDTYFPGKPYVNRGISCQVTAQMLVRFYPDVIDLKPAAVVIFAGTNDIARNNGVQTAEQVAANIQAMTELAKVHGIKVILCSITPIADYGTAPMSPGRPPADILKLNAWMKDYAAKVGAEYCDYFSALVDDKGFMKPNISRDGLHPQDAGYQLMVPVVNASIAKALGTK